MWFFELPSKVVFLPIRLIHIFALKLMYKLVLLAVFTLLLCACERKNTQEPAPDKVITDTVAHQIGRHNFLSKNSHLSYVKRKR
jgi:hypothetical protein